MITSSGKGTSLTTIEEFRRRAKELLTEEGWLFYNAAAGQRSTFQESVTAFDRYVIRPRILRDVTRRSLSTTVLGQPISMPICVAPSAAQRFAHPDAEAASAKGTADADTLYIMSSFASSAIAEVSQVAPGGLKWMQLYLFRDRRFAENVVREAEKKGFKAIVLTVDLPLWPDFSSNKSSTSRYHYDPNLRPTNLALDIPEVNEAIRSGDVNLRHFFAEQYKSPKTWDDITWLKSITSLPIVLKGILTGEAAQEAADAGVSGIIVSAHGGRYMDGIPAPLDVLPEVVSAVKGRGVEVYMDGGIRSGTDVLKALGLGARAVLIGRPALWGLACDGPAGVNKVLSILRNELDMALGISGCTNVQDIPPSLIARKSYL
ncbi:hydroxyacid oxidase 1-like [Lytechinus variegatus]|uniref:hydroxyacid oxidase 1-like n=1 Tax=Lytechinus variegatus TaxID=7654 RepID=UPI001BB1A506|nr:hydroxyacid oxidase 1-like [Lytechinus variegatus]